MLALLYNLKMAVFLNFIIQDESYPGSYLWTDTDTVTIEFGTHGSSSSKLQSQ